MTAAALARPATLAADPAGIPTELTGPGAVDWVVWRLEPKKDKVGEWTKEPYQAAHPSRHASSTNPATWSTFGEAFSAYQLDPTLHGVGRVLHGDGVAGIDLDNALDESGHAKPWARAIVAKLPGAHWERSPGGRGLRGLCRGTLPPGRRKVKYADGVVELYDDDRYLTMTGVPLLDDPGDIFPVETLPDLQAEVEALHAEILGGESIAAAAVVTELTGAAADVTPDALRVLEAVLGGRYAAQMAKVWAADFADFDGDESNGEWALAKETVYHALQLGHEGDALALVVEQLMRAGPYRPKWDSPRTVTLGDKTTVRTTWLGMTIGRAIGARERKHPELVIEEAPAPAAASETSEQTIARLTRELAQANRELAQERAAGAVRQTVIRNLRAENQELRARFAGIVGVMENKNLRGNETTIALRLAFLTHSALDRADQPAGPPESRVNLTDLGERAGASKDAAGRALDLLSGPGGPFEKRRHSVTGPFHNPKTGEILRNPKTGQVIPAKTILSVTPRSTTLTETLNTLQAFTPERESLNDWGGRRVPRCELHPDTKPTRRTIVICGEPGCERILDGGPDRPKRHLAVLVLPPPPRGRSPLQGQDAVLVGSQVPLTNGRANGHPNGPGATDGHAPTVATLPRSPSPINFWRCACTALERHRRAAFGDWVCSGCTMQVPSPDERP